MEAEHGPLEDYFPFTNSVFSTSMLVSRSVTKGVGQAVHDIKTSSEPPAAPGNPTPAPRLLDPLP